ncbi:unnamed protein product [Mytilus edulis]|uniref:Uncharacterized protein n=1 Tax=Mytilus edulis TaxID=6550 RepID=A0A8S3SY53_MYTED|nr:unnamed protein product [Mytilus edulis]
MAFALQFINEGIANSASEKVANNNISGFGMSSFSDQVKYKDFDIFDSSLGRLVPSCDKSMSSLLGKKPVDGLRLTQPVWSKTENLLRSASQVLGTAEHFLAATGHLLNSLRFGCSSRTVQEELSKNPPPVKVSVQVTNGKRSVNATSSSTSTSASGGPPSSAKKGRITLTNRRTNPITQEKAQFKNPPPLSAVPISLSHTQDPVKCQLLSVEVDTMLQKAAIEEVSILTLSQDFISVFFWFQRRLEE